MRLYLPTTLSALARFVDADEVEGIEGYLPGGEDEESEYAALMQAAVDSQQLLDEGDGPGRRVVVVAEIAGTADPDAPVPLRRVVAVHADPTDRPAGSDPDEDLAWYASQEITALLQSRPEP